MEGRNELEYQWDSMGHGGEGNENNEHNVKW